MSGYRLTAGGIVDRSREIGFTWDGRSLRGHPGDTLASALLACGERTIGRSFKYHRPRGVFSAGVEEPAAYVTLGRGAEAAPNAKAPTVELREGLEAFGQNAWPSVRLDCGAVTGLVSGIPSRWVLLQDLHRAVRGHGILDVLRAFHPKGGRHGPRFAGTGPRALRASERILRHPRRRVRPCRFAAAETAAGAGLDVLLCEQDFALGGALLAETGEVEGDGAGDWLAARREMLELHPNVPHPAESLRVRPV